MALEHSFWAAPTSRNLQWSAWNFRLAVWRRLLLLIAHGQQASAHDSRRQERVIVPPLYDSQPWLGLINPTCLLQAGTRSTSIPWVVSLAMPGWPRLGVGRLSVSWPHCGRHCADRLTAHHAAQQTEHLGMKRISSPDPSNASAPLEGAARSEGWQLQPPRSPGRRGAGSGGPVGPLAGSRRPLWSLMVAAGEHSPGVRLDVFWPRPGSFGAVGFRGNSQLTLAVDSFLIEREFPAGSPSSSAPTALKNSRR